MVENRGGQAAGTAGLFLALSWIFVTLRCYCRIAIVRRFGVEDYLCVIAQVIQTKSRLRNRKVDAVQILFTLYATSVLLGVRYGTGKHVIDIVPASNLPIALKVSSLSSR